MFFRGHRRARGLGRLFAPGRGNCLAFGAADRYKEADACLRTSAVSCAFTLGGHGANSRSCPARGWPHSDGLARPAAGDVGIAFALCCRSEGTCLFDILVGVGWWKTFWDPYGAEDRDDIFERDLGICAGFDECADVFDDGVRRWGCAGSDAGASGGAGHDESALFEGFVGLGRGGLRHCEIPGRLADGGKAFAVSELPGTDRASKEFRDVLRRARSGCCHMDARGVRSCASGTFDVVRRVRRAARTVSMAIRSATATPVPWSR